MRHSFTIFLVVLLAALGSAQSPPEASEPLRLKMAELYRAGNYDAAIPLGEQIVAIERKGNKPQDLLTALDNLAQARLARFKLYVTQLNGGAIETAKLKDTVSKVQGDAESSELYLREGIRLADADPAGFRSQRIGLRTNLAWILYNYRPPDAETKVEYDKTGRDRFAMRERARSQKRIDEAETLFREALKLSLADAAPGDTALLQTEYRYAEFALATGNLESAIASLENCIAEVERRFGKTSPSLAEPLESYIKALVATGQDDLAFEMVSRLVRVTRKTAGLPKTLLNLSFRADKAFTPVNASSIDAKTRANQESAILVRKATTIGAAPDVILGTSTFGKTLYDRNVTTSIATIPVRVSVDETGKVIEAEALSGEKDLQNDAEDAVREWKFRPVIMAGKARPVRGYVDVILFVNRGSK